MSELSAPSASLSIEIWLTKNAPSKPWIAHSVRKRDSRHVHRLVFDNPGTPDTVLCTQVAELLAARLKSRDLPSVFTDRELRISLPGLELCGLRVIVNTGDGQRQSAVVRFAAATGDLNAILHRDYRSQVAPVADVTRFTVPVLQNLLLPALELFDHIVEQGLSEPQHEAVQARLKTLIRQRQELGDLSGLLMEFATSRLVAEQNDAPEQQDAPVLRYQHPGSVKQIGWSVDQGWHRGLTQSVNG